MKLKRTMNTKDQDATPHLPHANNVAQEHALSMAYKSMSLVLHLGRAIGVDEHRAAAAGGHVAFEHRPLNEQRPISGRNAAASFCTFHAKAQNKNFNTNPQFEVRGSGNRRSKD